MNLIPLLEGKEGTTLYTPLAGNVKLIRIEEDEIIVEDTKHGRLYFASNGYYLRPYGSASTECLLFPSSSQRNWEKYAQKMPGLGETYFYADILIGKAILLPEINTGEYADVARITSGNYFTIKSEGEEFVKEINNKFQKRIKNRFY